LGTFGSGSGSAARARKSRRRLRFEPLEDRRLLIASSPTIDEFPAGAALSSAVNGITFGANGTEWFTEQTQTLNGVSQPSKIGKITEDGTVTEYDILNNDGVTKTSNAFPGGIAGGSHGSLWFTEGIGNIVKFDPSTGHFTSYPIIGGGSPTAIAAVFDQDLLDFVMYFTDQRNNAIGKITPDGTITEYSIPTSGSYPYGIAEGPDGNAWFTELFGNNIGRMTPDGAIQEFPLDGFPQPEGITAGPDGALWFTEQNSNQIGRITPAGIDAATNNPTITEFPIFWATSPGPLPTSIATGADGNLWFTEAAGNKLDGTTYRIGQIKPSTGEITEFPIPTSANSPTGITGAPDGNLWFGESHVTQDSMMPPNFVYSGQIGRITPAANPAPVADMGISTDFPSPVKVGDQITFHLTVKNNSATNTATNVIVYDPIPAGAKFSGSASDFTSSAGAGSASVTNGQGIAKLGNLAPGASASVTLTVTASALGQVINRAYVRSDSPETNDSNNETAATVNVVPPTTSFVFGGAFTANGVLNDPLKFDPNTGASTTGKFNWALTRTGGDPPQNVVVTMTIPATLTDIAAYPPNIFSYNSTTRLLTFAFSTIASQATVNFGFTARPTAVGDVTVTATVADDGVITGVPLVGNPPLPGKALTAHVQAEATALSLSGVLVGDATGSPMEFDPGTSAPVTSGIFGWQLKNTGETTITGATISIPLTGQPLTNIVPDAYIDSIFSPVGNTSYNPATKTITISGLPNLAPKGKPIRFGFLADPTAPGQVSVTAKVTISGNLTGTNPPSNSISSTVNTTVEQPAVSLSLNGGLSIVTGSAGATSASVMALGPALATATSSSGLSGSVNVMTINAKTGTVDTSGKFTWKLTNNSGHAVASITVTIPSLDQLKNISPFAGGTYSAANNRVTFSFPTIAAGETKTFGFAADPKAIGPLSVTANVSAAGALVGGSSSLSQTISTVVFSEPIFQLAPGPGPAIAYGPVIANADLVPIYYGSQWKAAAALPNVVALPGLMHGAMQSIVSGPYMDFLAQYSTNTQKIGRGKVESDVYFSATAAPEGVANPINDNGDSTTSVIKAAVVAQISSMISPTGVIPSANTVCVVFTPPNTVIQNSGGGGDSTKNFVGYHNAINIQFTNSRGTVVASRNYYYIVMPWQGFPNGVSPPADYFQRMTVVFSHELAEAVTDPGLTNGWRDYDAPGQPEIGDIETWNKYQSEDAEGNLNAYGMLNGYAVQYEWANQYTYPGTDFTVYDQPVLPQNGTDPTFKVKTIVDPFRKTIGGASVADTGYLFSGPIGSFEDTTNTSSDPSIYTATIDWGDDSTSTGTITYDGNLNQFLISAAHDFDSASGSTATVNILVVNNVTGAAATLSANVTLQQTSTDAASLQFDNATFDAYRNGSDAVITVDRVGDVTLPATVDFHVSGGTAVDGTDYQAQSGTLQFGPGATTATILLPIYSNPAAAGDLTVNLMLSTPTGNTVLGTQTTTVVTIHSSDQVFAPPAPVLDSDTGAFVNDSITLANGSADAPLTFIVTGASVRNGYLQLVDVTDPDNPVILGEPVQAVNGAATITLADVALDDGTHQIAVINSVGLTAGARRASQATSITIDSVTPTSSLTGVPAFTSLVNLPVNWSGDDNATGSGLQGFNISVSVDGADAIPWLENTTDTSATYSATLGHSYDFFSAAVDVAGNTEPMHAIADASVLVTATPWHNPHTGRGLDVTDDGHIVADDVITIINYINAHRTSDLPASILTSSPAHFIDTDGDNKATATDVINVINFINSHHGGSEGEAAEPSTDTAIQSPATQPQVSSDDSLLLLIAADVATQVSTRRGNRI
jgi:virginiamycin B lyase